MGCSVVLSIIVPVAASVCIFPLYFYQGMGHGNGSTLFHFLNKASSNGSLRGGVGRRENFTKFEE